MKKLLSLMLSTVLITGLITACDSANNGAAGSGETGGNAAADTAQEAQAPAGTDETDGAGEAAAGGEKIQITVTRWGEITENDAEKMMVDKFNAESDAIEIIYDVVPGDGYGDRLTTSFSSGEGYDIFASGEGDFYKWVETGMAAPMDDLMAADGDWTADFNPAILEMGNIQGSQYYIVRDYNPICLWYNKDVFDKNNVEYPTNDWTWEDLETAARALTVKGADGSFESFGFNAQTWEYASLTYLQSAGVNILSPDGSTADGYLNSPEMVTALERYVGYSRGDDRISPNTSDFEAFGSASAMLIDGSLGMTLDGGWALQGMKDSGINYGTAVVPGNHESYLCASAFAISSRCENPEAAWEVIKALTGPECTELRTQYTAALPTIDSQLEILKGSLGENNLGLIDQLAFSVQPAGVRSPLGGHAVRAFVEAYERVLFQDGETQTIMDEAVEAANTGAAP